MSMGNVSNTFTVVTTVTALTVAFFGFGIILATVGAEA